MPWWMPVILSILNRQLRWTCACHACCGCGALARRLKPVEQAFKAADILVQNGGFGVIAIDLGNVEETLDQENPAHHLVPFCPRDGEITNRTGGIDGVLRQRRVVQR